MHVRPLLLTEEIDHQDKNPFNNRISNLRIATRVQNMHNTRGHRNKAGGLPKGVQKHGPSYRASIMVNRKLTRLGVYPTPQLATEAYLLAESRMLGNL